MMEKELGQPVNVVNRTGGGGVVGHSAIAQAPADGYTIGMITVEITMMHWQGLTELNPTSYTPLGARQLRPGRLHRARRFAVQVGQGSARLRQGQPGQDEGVGHRAGRHLASGARRPAERPEDSAERDSVGAVQRRRAGDAGSRRRRRRHRHVLAARGARADRGRQGAAARGDGRQAARRCFPNVPTMQQAIGINWTVAAWRGIAGAQGNAGGRRRPSWSRRSRRSADSKECKDFAASKGYGTAWAPQAEFAAFMAKGDADMGVVDEGGRPRQVIAAVRGPASGPPPRHASCPRRVAGCRRSRRGPDGARSTAGVR